MSSSPHFEASSPLHCRQKSQFTYRHLSLLAQSSTSCPLRCIALIDYDAFYAQCESVRLGLADEQPLAVQQWQGLIAINYAARSFDLSRHATVQEAKKKCPQIVLQHVATWREGDDKWAYRDDASQHIQTDKVSLDPYRLESRKSLALVKEILPPAPVQRVEKASIDEVFLDLSAQIHAILLERYPELRTGGGGGGGGGGDGGPHDDPTDHLPLPPHTVLNWEADALVDLDKDQTEDDDPDWDDVVMNIGSEIVRGVRQKIYERLKYTCSAGIARNKMMAKLGAGYKKPNQQTIVRNRATQHFLSGFKFTKIRNLGGKLGDQVVEAFNTDTVQELLQIPLETLRSKFGNETGAWIFSIIRGEDRSEVVSRTAIKSMLSAKSFRPSVSSLDQAVKWLRIFVADIYGRLVEEGVLENKRRPRTITLHHRHQRTNHTHSKQLPIPTGKAIDEAILFGLAKTLLAQFVVDGGAWPCSNLSLSVGGFEEGMSGNRQIGSFLVKGDDNVRASMTTSTTTAVEDSGHQAKKKRRVDADDVSNGITRFFKTDNTAALNAEDLEMQQHYHDNNNNYDHCHRTSILSYVCPNCKQHIPETERDEHQDWHFAKSLQAQDSPPKARPRPSGPANSRPPGIGLARGKRGRGGGAKVDKGQSKLVFGR
ncbi:hypothetical protein DV738_g3835, partial [Chaetothyriales sp. CBS 135597]